MQRACGERGVSQQEVTHGLMPEQTMSSDQFISVYH